MARTKVMTLWTSIVTAFLALCTALGLITTTASAAVPQTSTHSNSESASRPASPVAAVARTWARPGSLPPTMKQRIRAEAHGTAPSCRHRPLADTTSVRADGPLRDIAEPSARHTVPLQR